MQLSGKVALVTGSSRGIGKAIALELACAEAGVAVTYNRRKKAAEKVCSTIVSQGGKAIVCQVDTARRASIRKAIQRTRKQLGPIDILVNNAGVHQRKDFLKITDKGWDYILSTNLKGAFMCIQEVLPDMLTAKSGRIVNISSIAGERGGIYAVHYAAAKAGLINLTRSMARLYSGRNIQTYCIAPNLIETDMSKPVNMKEEIKNIPAKRIGLPVEVAKLVLFLCGPGADYMTGQTINFNGGEYFAV